MMPEELINKIDDLINELDSKATENRVGIFDKTGYQDSNHSGGTTGAAWAFGKVCNQLRQILDEYEGEQ